MKAELAIWLSHGGCKTCGENNTAVRSEMTIRQLVGNHLLIYKPMWCCLACFHYWPREKRKCPY